MEGYDPKFPDKVGHRLRRVPGAAVGGEFSLSSEGLVRQGVVGARLPSLGFKSFWSRSARLLLRFFDAHTHATHTAYTHKCRHAAVNLRLSPLQIVVMPHT